MQLTSKSIQFFLFIFTHLLINESRSQVLTSDSLALVALYNATDGANWIDNSNWLTGPVEDWVRVTVTGNRVTNIGFFTDNGINGTIPPELSDLSALNALYLVNNDGLTGSIPPELGNLTNLEILHLNRNQLSGSIPAALGNLSKLRELILLKNQLSGPIPKELGDLTNLTELTISQNQLSGSIPKELGNLSSLQFLLLWGNQLTGQVPSEFGNLAAILRLNVMDNQLTGEIPSTLGNLPLIRDLIVNDNNLSGPIPPSFSQLTTLLNLIISSNQFSELPDLTNLTQLTTFDVSSNCFGNDDIALNQSVITSNTGQNNCFGTITIDQNPTDKEVCEGDAVSFSVTASGASNLQYQWQENRGSGFTDLSNGSNVTGFATATLNISNILPSSNSFTYRCVVSGDGTDDITSDEASLMVIEDVSITSQPVSQNASLGQSVTLTVIASGDNLTYQWRKDETAITGATSPSLTLGNVTATDAGSYTCRVSNACNALTSVPALLEVAEQVGFTVSIEGEEIASGETVDMGAAVAGELVTRAFLITNTSTEAVTIESMTVVDIPEGFIILNAPNQIAAGASASFEIQASSVITGDALGTNVRIQASSGIFTFRVTVFFSESSTPPDLIIYNAVAPNGNGKHDFLKIKNIEFYADNTVQIYNRWGDKVYEVTGYNNQSIRFEGEGNVGSSKTLVEGNYYYVIKTARENLAGFLFLRR